MILITLNCRKNSKGIDKQERAPLETRNQDLWRLINIQKKPIYNVSSKSWHSLSQFRYKEKYPVFRYPGLPASMVRLIWGKLNIPSID